MKFFFNAAAMLSEWRITVSRVVQTARTIILTKGLTLIKHNIIQDLALAVHEKKESQQKHPGSAGLLNRAPKVWFCSGGGIYFMNMGDSTLTQLI